MTSTDQRPNGATKTRTPTPPAASQAAPNGLDAALLALQADMPEIVKTKEGDTGSHKYDYADMADVTDALYPAMTKLGLIYKAKTASRETKATTPDGTVVTREEFGLEGRLVHVPTGEFDVSWWPFGSPKQKMQDTGGMITYARRYLLVAMVGAAPRGDDADGPQQFQQPPRPPSSGQRPPQPDGRRDRDRRQRGSEDRAEGPRGQAQAIALAKLAIQLSGTAPVGDLKAKVHDQAAAKRLLDVPVPGDQLAAGWFDGETVALSKVITEARERIQARQQRQARDQSSEPDPQYPPEGGDGYGS